MKKIRENIFLVLFAISMMFLFSVNVYAYCPLGPDVTEDLHGVLRIFNILAPLLCIVFSIVEFIKAITKGDAEGEMKKVFQRFGKRMIYTFILAFIPVLVDQVMIMAGFWDEDGKCDLNVYQENGASNVWGDDPVTTRSTSTTAASITHRCNSHGMQSCSQDSFCFWTGSQSGGICKPICSYLGIDDCNKQDHCKVTGPSQCSNR